ncbi:hypothetical protein J3R82DRAFT_8993 [Butyriboletus roseoflavus]|nr:hypothetical protein J3R82DRAFT_8993 [Butyriboletus roseoflavus]
MQSLSRRARQCPRIRLVVIHSQRISSLLTVAPLEKRTLGFSKLAHRVTKEPTWELVPLLRYIDSHDPTLRDVLQRCGISSDEWTRWSPIVYSPTLERALDLLQRTHAEHASHHTPSWVVLALASHKIRSPSDAQSALYDLAFPLTSPLSPRPLINKFYAFPLLILTTHSLAYFSLISPLRPLTSHLLGLPPHSHTYESFHFNTFLQAISLFDRSRVAADVAVDVLREMENRDLTLWPNTERVLIRDNFRSPQLLDYFHRHGSFLPGHAEKQEKSESRLRACASLGRVQSSAYYLRTIRKQCLENGITPPYTSGDNNLIDSDAADERVQGTAHKANTHYLRAMRDDRQSAFRYFHHLLKLDLTKSRQSPPPSSPPSLPGAANKSNIDIYDWTTALYAGAHDHAFSASSLLELFKATREGTNAYKPTRATYTVVIQGLLRKNALEDAQKLWDEFVGEVVSARGDSEENEMRMDRKALCVGIDVLVQSGRTEEALYLLDEAVKRDIEEVTASSTPNASSGSKFIRTSTSPYLKVHPIHALFTALLRIRRPDAIFYIWTHLTSLYFVPPTNLMLRLLLKAAMQASKMDGESLKGAMSWYINGNRLFKKEAGPIAPTMTPYKTSGLSESGDYEIGKDTSASDHNPESKGQTSVETETDDPPPSHETLAARLRTLLQTPTPPPVVGIWANRRSTEVARSIFRGMIFGNWPALRGAAGPFGGGVTSARAKGGESVFQELARVFASRPNRFLPSHPTLLGAERPTMVRSDVGDERMGPPLPTVMPSESTFTAYISLLGLSSRAEEIPEVLVWMRALSVVPKTETLAVALVFWMEVGLRGPVFEDGWVGWGRGAGPESPKTILPNANATGSTSACVPDREAKTTERADAPPKTEYGALRGWIREWVGEKKAPTEEDIYAGIKRVREMRDSQFGKRGGHVVVKDAKQKEEMQGEARAVVCASWALCDRAYFQARGFALLPRAITAPASPTSTSPLAMDLFAYIDRTEPSSPTSATPASGSVPPFEDPSSRTFSELKKLGRTTYKDVWNEFYDWEPGYCEDILRTVTQSILASKRQVARVAKTMVTKLLNDAEERVPGRLADGTDAVGISVTHFTAGGHRGAHERTTELSIPVITIDAYSPHPRYESCPPVSRSVLVDVAHEQTLPFLPYADDDQFPAQEYQARFDFLEWETPFDPDGERSSLCTRVTSKNLLGAVVEMIQIETVRRLAHAKNKVDILDIDRMHMFKEFRHTHNSGLLREQSQRLVHVPIPNFFQNHT